MENSASSKYTNGREIGCSALSQPANVSTNPSLLSIEALFGEVTSTWQVARPAPSDVMVDCSQTCTTWGWAYARRPCEPPPPLAAGLADGTGWRGFEKPWNGSLCKLDPVAAGWRCCFLRTGDGKD